VTPEHTSFAEELFGPVASVIRCGSADEAVALANYTKFGLGAAVWTADLDLARRMSREIDAGAVFINGMVASDARLPFGGIKKFGLATAITLTSVGVATPKRSVPITKTGISSAGRAVTIWPLNPLKLPTRGERGRSSRLATNQTATNMPIPSIPPTSARKHRSDIPKADHVFRLNLDHLTGALHLLSAAKLNAKGSIEVEFAKPTPAWIVWQLSGNFVARKHRSPHVEKYRNFNSMVKMFFKSVKAALIQRNRS
jgi:hypothetical protein